MPADTESNGVDWGSQIQPGGRLTDEIVRRWVVRGRVQGVGFRWFTVTAATMIGVVGWVRNRPDGAVEVIAQGAESDLEALENRLQTGPPFSVVRAVEKADISSEMEMPKTFEVR